MIKDGVTSFWVEMARLATLPRHGQQTSERIRLDTRIET